MIGSVETKSQKLESCLMYQLFIGLFHADHLRISCDLMNFYFAFDEYTDMASKEEARKIAHDVMDAFRNTEKPTNNQITEMARQ